MLGDLGSYAVVSVTPETDLAVITCTHSLGVEPKLVRVKTNDRSEASARIYEFVLVRSFGATLNRYNNNENARGCSRSETEPTNSNYRAYYMSNDTIKIVSSAAASKWKAGVTYTFHIYA